MLQSSKSKWAQGKPPKAETAAKDIHQLSPNRPDLHRLAYELAAEWCSRADDLQPQPGELAP